MRSSPLVIAFADHKYRPLLEIWHRQLVGLGIGRIAIYALDGDTLKWCRDRGIAVTEVPWSGQLGDLWIRRIQIFQQLLDESVDFIHSDIDAMWVRNPLVSGSAADLDDDLLFSPGTIWPHDVHARWGFVLCCGWFWARSTEASRRFFRALESSVRVTGDDQMSVNRLLADAGTGWNTATAGNYQIPFSGRVVQCWPRALRATTADQLSVALLPPREFQCLPDDAHHAVVKHYLTPKNCSDKLQALAKFNLI